MTVLLDTPAFIWWDSDPTKLSPQARAVCEGDVQRWFLGTLYIIVGYRRLSHYDRRPFNMSRVPVG